MRYVKVENMDEANGWVAVDNIKYISNAITVGKFYKFHVLKTEFQNTWDKDESTENWIVDDNGNLCMAFDVCKGYFAKEVNYGIS